MSDERYLTRREAEILIAESARSEAEHFAYHHEEHRLEKQALDIAFTAANVQIEAHSKAHTEAHGSHAQVHAQEQHAVQTALVAVARERAIHAEAHEREHAAHLREHVLVNLAVDKAEAATDKRFNTSNAYREQINDLIRNLTSKDAFEAHLMESGRRIEDVKAAIIELQKYDVRGEGRMKGQGLVIAGIVTAVSVIGGLLGITIILANLLTSHP